jgi:hypothetical protein
VSHPCNAHLLKTSCRYIISLFFFQQRKHDPSPQFGPESCGSSKTTPCSPSEAVTSLFLLLTYYAFSHSPSSADMLHFATCASARPSDAAASAEEEGGGAPVRVKSASALALNTSKQACGDESGRHELMSACCSPFKGEAQEGLSCAAQKLRSFISEGTQGLTIGDAAGENAMCVGAAGHLDVGVARSCRRSVGDDAFSSEGATDNGALRFGATTNADVDPVAHSSTRSSFSFKGVKDGFATKEAVLLTWVHLSKSVMTCSWPDNRSHNGTHRVRRNERRTPSKNEQMNLFSASSANQTASRSFSVLRRSTFIRRRCCCCSW